MDKRIPIEVSARHVHLSQNDLEVLFGKGYQLKKLRNLVQPREFAAKETLDIQTGSRKISNIRIIGPVREKTQVELSHTDGVFLRIELPVRESEDLEDTPGAVLISSKGKIKIKKGVINAWRHIHCSPKEAKELGFKNGMSVSVKTKGTCSIIFHNVKIQVDKDYRLCMHLDTDEGNAACMAKKGQGYLVTIV